MKHSGIIIFLSIALTLYALMNFYIIRRGLQALPAQGWPRALFLVLIITLASAYPLGRWLESTINPRAGSLLVHIGAYYTAAMMFALFTLLAIDLVRLANRIVPFLPVAWRGGHSQNSLGVFWLVTSFIALTTLAGAINARHIRVRHLPLEIAKQTPLETMRIVLATDIHLGTLIHNSRLQEIVTLINAQTPDLILFGGDLFDEDVLSLSRQNMAELLRQLEAPYGVYAILGNHEYISGSERAVSYMEEAGITVLRDQAVKVADALWLIGREDRQAVYQGRKRIDLATLVAGTDKRQPLILLDHQPFHLEEAQEQGIDLQLSGHTHHGQFFPLHLFTRAIYEVSWGYLRKGTTHYYVSCGAGTWGPPVRLGNRPEIVVIDITFNPQ